MQRSPKRSSSTRRVPVRSDGPAAIAIAAISGPVRAVGIDLEPQVGECLGQSRDGLHVPSRSDLDLHPRVALVDEAAHGDQQLGHGRFRPHHCSGLDEADPLRRGVRPGSAARPGGGRRPLPSPVWRTPVDCRGRPGGRRRVRTARAGSPAPMPSGRSAPGPDGDGGPRGHGRRPRRRTLSRPAPRTRPIPRRGGRSRHALRSRWTRCPRSGPAGGPARAVDADGRPWPWPPGPRRAAPPTTTRLSPRPPWHPGPVRPSGRTTWLRGHRRRERCWRHHGPWPEPTVDEVPRNRPDWRRTRWALRPWREALARGSGPPTRFRRTPTPDLLEPLSQVRSR